MALVARNLDTGTVLADRVSVAATRASRRAGLLNHDSLDEGEALWIVPSHGVHTFRMRFAIDVLALDEAGVIIDRIVNLKPWRIRLPKRGTAGVLELPAGWLDRTGTVVGHRIEFFTSPLEPSGRRPIDSDRPDTSI
jgi:uncharacterized membrane protein (UPF0127 family)